MTDVMLSAFRATKTNETYDRTHRSNRADFWNFALDSFLALMDFLADSAALDSDLRFDFCEYVLDVDGEESDHVAIAGKFPSQRRRVRATFQVMDRSPLEAVVRLGSQAVNGWK
ncbi:Hypothetical protein PENO1_052850 [Penicillium occitanis (nom. inval.)]|nr:Hypothetical protein PENO1_052850 [Penicillium occitanis (nom. inval.)]PCH02481.1 hypothetical protein PENOC_043280 [Penicillium occitanis (nom. inval.)]